MADYLFISRRNHIVEKISGADSGIRINSCNAFPVTCIHSCLYLLVRNVRNRDPAACKIVSLSSERLKMPEKTGETFLRFWAYICCGAFPLSVDYGAT